MNPRHVCCAALLAASAAATAGECGSGMLGTSRTLTLERTAAAYGRRC